MAATPSLILTALSLLFFPFLLLLLLLLRRRHSHSDEQQHRSSSSSASAIAAADQISSSEKKRKKRGRKKRQGEVPGSPLSCPEMARAADAAGGGIGGSGCPLPFSSLGSATQRKIKARYDELVRSNHAKALTMAQVGEFVNCLVEAKNELQQKSEVIKRSFKIKKALLFKADRSSFDRISQQIYKLETEHKRLEQDAAVYNLLQEQLKLSPAYKTIVEISTSMEFKESKDPPEQIMEFSDISFEELLAQEKKDSFWQKNGRMRSFAS